MSLLTALDELHREICCDGGTNRRPDYCQCKSSFRHCFSGTVHKEGSGCPDSRHSAICYVYFFFIFYFSPSHSDFKPCVHYPDYPHAPELHKIYLYEFPANSVPRLFSRRRVCAARLPASCRHAALRRTTPPSPAWLSPSCCCLGLWSLSL